MVFQFTHQKPNLDRREKFAVIKAADVYAMAQTTKLMFDTATTTFEPRRAGQITVGTPAMPEGMPSDCSAG